MVSHYMISHQRYPRIIFRRMNHFALQEEVCVKESCQNVRNQFQGKKKLIHSLIFAYVKLGDDP